MFFVSVHLSVGLSAGFHKTYRLDFHKTWMYDVSAQNRPMKGQIQDNCLTSQQNICFNFSGENSWIQFDVHPNTNPANIKIYLISSWMTLESFKWACWALAEVCALLSHNLTRKTKFSCSPQGRKSSHLASTVDK